MVLSKIQGISAAARVWIALLCIVGFAVLASSGREAPEGQQQEAKSPRVGNQNNPVSADDRHMRLDLVGDPLPPGALARCGTARLRHGDLIRCLAVSPDGKIVGSVGESLYSSHPGNPDPVVRLWDAATGTELRQCRGHVVAPVWVLFSPDGKTLASLAAVGTGQDETVRLWDVSSGKQLRVLQHQRPEQRGWFRYAMAFSADGRMLASSGRDGTIRLWDVATGKQLRYWSERGGSLALAFSLDGKVLACATGEAVRLLDVSSGDARQTELHNCPGTVEALQFSPDGKTIVSGNSAVHLAPDGKTILWDKYIGTVHWWEPANGKELRRLDGTLVAASADGKWLAIHQGRDILLWDMVADKEARRFPLDVTPAERGEDVFVGSFSADGNTLVMPDRSTIRILDTRTGKECRTFPGHSDDVVLLNFSPDGRRLISAGDRSVRFWDPLTGKELGTLGGPAHSIHAASMSADATILAAGTWGSAMHVWDVDAGKELRRINLEAPARPCPALAPDGKTFAYKSLGGAAGIRLIDVASGKELRCFGYGNQYDALAFLPDGSALADLRSNLDLFDVQTGKHVLRTVDPNNACSGRAGMAFSPDSRMVATGYPDRAPGKLNSMSTVSLWEIASGQFIAQFHGHQGMVGAFAFAHSGRVVASGGWDGTVRVWDLPSGRELRKFQGHRGGLLSLAFSLDDKLLATGGSDTSILVWDVAELTANRPLPEVRLSGTELEKLWTELGADSAEVGYRALWQFTAGRKAAVGFLKDRLRSQSPPEESVKKLVADLDAEDFEVRERATQELSDLGRLAQPLLEKTRDGHPSVEVRRRVEKLLARLQNPGPGRAPEELRQLRAVQALEYGGTAEGRDLLEILAQQDPETPCGLAAKAALKRLAKQRR